MQDTKFFNDRQSSTPRHNISKLAERHLINNWSEDRTLVIVTIRRARASLPGINLLSVLQSCPESTFEIHLNINASVGAGTRLLQLVFGRVYLYFYVHSHDDQISLHPQIFNPNPSPIQNIQGVGARYQSAASETESAPWAEPKQQRPLPPKKQKSPIRPRSSCTPCPGVFGVIGHQIKNVRPTQEPVVWISCVHPRLTLRLHPFFSTYFNM